MTTTSTPTPIRADIDVPAVIKEVEARGFCVVPDVLSAEHCEALRAAVDRAAREDEAEGRAFTWDNEANQRIFALLNRGEEFIPMATDPVMHQVVEHFLGGHFLLAGHTAVVTGPGGLHGHLHQDQDWMPDPLLFPAAFQTIWMIDDFTVENGGTRIVPESHKLQRHPYGEEADVERVALCGTAGSVAFLEGRTWHQTGPNASNAKRRGIFVSYYRYWIRTFENWTLSLKPEVRAAHPELEALCGFESYNSIGSVNGIALELRAPTESTFGPTTDQPRRLHERGLDTE